MKQRRARRRVQIACAVLAVLALLVGLMAWRSRFRNDIYRHLSGKTEWSVSTFPGGFTVQRSVINDRSSRDPPFQSLVYGASAGVPNMPAAKWSPIAHDWSMFGFTVEHKQYLNLMGSWGGKYLNPIATNDPAYANSPDLADYRSVGVPFWFLAAVLFLPVAMVFWRTFWEARRARRRANLGLCPHCGYDLRAAKDRCPECGAAIVIVSASDLTVHARKEL